MVQERRAKSTSDSRSGGSLADAVVIGTLQVPHSLPWLDGWHRSARIDIQEVLLARSGRSTRTIQLDWVEPYLPPSHDCLTRSYLANKNGIWFLAERGGQWKLS
jgi:hypothetical protein